MQGGGCTWADGIYAFRAYVHSGLSVEAAPAVQSCSNAVIEAFHAGNDEAVPMGTFNVGVGNETTGDRNGNSGIQLS